jgi:signal transduction histidine kinase/AraC-like DNA-binding protein
MKVRPLTGQRVVVLKEELKRLAVVVDDLKLLNELSLTTSGALTIDEKLKIILEKSISAVNAEQGSILLATGDLTYPFKTLIRQSDQSTLRRSYHIGTHISGYVLYHKKPIRITRLQNDRRFEATDEERADIKSVLCVPITNQDALIGALMMINKKTEEAFSEEDQRLLSIVAAQSGQLIVNAHLQEEKVRKDQQLALSRLEAERLQELDHWRSKLFENVSHEFRAPLTLILAPLEHLLASVKNETIKNEYLLMRRNALRLLRLINEMLDMSRIEAGSMRLHVSPGDLVPFVASIVDAFVPAAVQKGIVLSLSTHLDRYDILYDPDKLEKVLYNLLSNALKFTPAHGKITVSVSERSDSADVPSQRWGVLEVADTGPGIPAEHIGRVFERYFQVSPSAMTESLGSGIGLCLAKDLVELHHGTISVESPPGGGSRFIVQIPVDRWAYADAEITPEQRGQEDLDAREVKNVSGGDRYLEQETRPDMTSPSRPREALPLMLLVEDDAELRRYMRDFLMHLFRVLECDNGEQGMLLAAETLPDVIVSDVVIPGIDGVELCRRVKTDERTSHIPVLLLTAHSSQDLKLVGLETGADDYLIKPFEWSEFAARIRNLVESRERLRRKIGAKAILNPSEIGIPSMDEVFLKKAIAVVERSLGDENFMVDDLAAGLGLSYGQLHRKVCALTNLTPVQFIRHLRLQRALQMIQRNAGTISEIAYTVGFGSPAYFTRCFHELFGMAPGEARAQARDNSSSPDSPTAC